jgi:hypothetical protein
MGECNIKNRMCVCIVQSHWERKETEGASDLEVPECTERWYTRFLTSMHNFVVTLEIGGDEYDYKVLIRMKVMIRFS